MAPANLPQHASPDKSPRTGAGWLFAAWLLMTLAWSLESAAAKFADAPLRPLAMYAALASFALFFGALFAGLRHGDPQ